MFGEGILKGLAETARNFFGSFVSPERLTTVEYPERRIAPFEAARVFPFLVYDGEDPLAGLRCVACQICEKECPPQCIFIVKSSDKKPDFVGKPQNYPVRFEIDISVCMSCQICVEVCPFDAIKMNTEFELSTGDRFGGLLLNLDQLVKPNEYYHRIHPAGAAEVDARLAGEKAKAEEKAKAAAEAARAAAEAAQAKAASEAAAANTTGEAGAAKTTEGVGAAKAAEETGVAKAATGEAEAKAASDAAKAAAEVASQKQPDQEGRR